MDGNKKLRVTVGIYFTYKNKKEKSDSAVNCRKRRHNIFFLSSSFLNYPPNLCPYF